jgi:hypothetical protein
MEFDGLTSAQNLAQIEQLCKWLDLMHYAARHGYPEASLADAARQAGSLYADLKKTSAEAVAHANLVAAGQSF